MAQVIKLLRPHTAEDALPPQAQVLMKTLEAKVAVGDTVERDALITDLEEAEAREGDHPKLNTRQKVSMIWGFYRTLLTTKGLIEVEGAQARAPRLKKELAEGEEAPPKRTRKVKAVVEEEAPAV